MQHHTLTRQQTPSRNFKADNVVQQCSARTSNYQIAKYSRWWPPKLATDITLLKNHSTLNTTNLVIKNHKVDLVKSSRFLKKPSNKKYGTLKYSLTISKKEPSNFFRNNLN
jgi:hypothetical protein